MFTAIRDVGAEVWNETPLIILSESSTTISAKINSTVTSFVIHWYLYSISLFDKPAKKGIAENGTLGTHEPKPEIVSEQ